MVGGSDDERLRALETRIAEAKARQTPKGSSLQRGFGQGEAAWRMVLELATGMGLGLAIGFGLDTVLGTKPLLMLVFALLGFAAGIRTMMKTARELARHAEDAGTRPEDKKD
jgi:ATP synthase protein I